MRNPRFTLLIISSPLAPDEEALAEGGRSFAGQGPSHEPGPRLRIRRNKTLGDSADIMTIGILLQARRAGLGRMLVSPPRRGCAP